MINLTCLKIIAAMKLMKGFKIYLDPPRIDVGEILPVFPNLPSGNNVSTCVKWIL